jgi:metal-dependent hydrolase (beta-lactamase superfamily II)
VAIAESCILGGIGAELNSVANGALLFAEQQSVVVLSCLPAEAQLLVEMADAHNVPLRAAGIVGGTHLRVDGVDLSVDELREDYEGGLPRALGG